MINTQKLKRIRIRPVAKARKDWIFPNGSYYYRKGIQIDPNSFEGQTIRQILERQKHEED